MKTSLIMVFILSLSLGAAAYKKKAVSASTTPLRHDLSSSLLELQRVAQRGTRLLELALLEIDQPKVGVHLRHSGLKLPELLESSFGLFIAPSRQRRLSFFGVAFD